MPTRGSGLAGRYRRGAGVWYGLVDPAMRAYLISHLVTVLGAAASFVMMSGLVGSRRTSQATLAWLLALLFVPFLAIPLFLFFGSRKFPAKAKGPDDRARREPWTGVESPIAQVLATTGVAPPRGGHSFELLPNGEVAYARLLELIGGAQQTIDLTMFILGHDATGDAIIDLLVQRAAAGVSVRVILDAVGCAPTRHRAAAKLAAVHGEVRAFMPLAHSPIRGRTNLRSHRKLVIVDGVRLFAGGMNFADEYMGAGPRKGSEPRWRDVAAITVGAVATDATAMFESDWAYCGGEARTLASKVSMPTAGDAVVELVPSGPDWPTDTVYDLFLTAIFGAKSRIAIVTPYYVPDDQLQHALVLAARRGVDTQIVVPTYSNHKAADVARRALLRELGAAGVRVRYYPHGMVHAKAMVIDDAFAYVGSPNFDMRSLFLNYENALCVYSPDAIGQVRGYVDGLMAQCEDAGPPVTRRPIYEELARFLAPEL